MSNGTLSERFSEYLGKIETATYSILAVLISLTILVTIASAARLLWEGLSNLSRAAQSLRVLNELLIVLMLVEILHTVRISLRLHVLLVAEPFLIVGLIASIRRMLVITLEAATLSKEGIWTTETARSVFQGTMIELALLGVLVLILVYSITLLRRSSPAARQLTEM
jgi:Phosphate-starvation-inducible E family